MARNASKSRRLTETEQPIGRHIVESVRHLISKTTKKDLALAWAMRRYVYTRLIHHEKGTPMQRALPQDEEDDFAEGLMRDLPEETSEEGSRTGPSHSYVGLHRKEHAACP